jgi:hypothetical protein
MITRHEILFVEGLISALKCLKVDGIPFADDSFDQGASTLAEYVLGQQKKNEAIKAFDTLFYRRPVSGSYDRLIEAMQRLNGRRISFSLRNPSYERAIIDTPEKIANQILNDCPCGLRPEFLVEAARQFCRGAQISCSG